MVQTFTLIKVAVGTLITATSVQTYFKWKIQGDFQKSEHHQKSMEIMKGYQPVKDYLGEPIGASWFDMNEDDNKCDGLNAHFAIPVTGPKGIGFLYYWSSRENYGDEWQVDQLDFKRSDNQQRWTFFMRKNKTNEENTTIAETPNEISK